MWFNSTESFAKVLSAGNRDLLRVIVEQAPGSLDELARITGKAKSNRSSTLPTMGRPMASSAWNTAPGCVQPLYVAPGAASFRNESGQVAPCAVKRKAAGLGPASYSRQWNEATLPKARPAVGAPRPQWHAGRALHAQRASPDGAGSKRVLTYLCQQGHHFHCKFSVR